jgi:hypothetical protein
MGGYVILCTSMSIETAAQLPLDDTITISCLQPYKVPSPDIVV